ncbi:YrdB family protein [Paramicrobacterium chengjingii]|uniref:YrdB family protein n=1 Tax=Paramicrobacterium chengjingii TaxID=2769067 RepID=A0ABX6YKD4_9MICO|nr:YrdB family protein [Microbacterium chengjingii]QPZ39231.1 YrdB family protein [Microbacterium chengjingii]
MTSTSEPVRVSVIDIVRFVLELFAFVSLGLWGFICFELPWNVVVGIGAPVIAIVLWALFRSPKAVFQMDVFGKAIVEIAVMGTAVFAWWDMGQPVVAAIFAIVAVTAGVINGRRELD